MNPAWKTLRHCVGILVCLLIIFSVFPNTIHSQNVKIKDSHLGVHFYLWADVGIGPLQWKENHSDSCHCEARRAVAISWYHVS